MNTDDRDQEAVAAVLRSMPPVGVSTDFLARVNARIDETAGWLGLVNFRAWTLGLVPAAAALALVAVLWPVSWTPGAAPAAATAYASSNGAAFSPSSTTDWERDVTSNALLEAALKASPDRSTDHVR